MTISRALTDSDITTGDRRSFRGADLIIEAANGTETVYVAVEISDTADRRDSDRAERNARYLAQHMNLPALAAVASVRNDRELQDLLLLALEEYRDQGYISTIRLAERIGWDAEGMPSPNGQGYGRLAVIGLLYKLYLAGRVEPAHQPNRRGHWGGWRISDEEYARRSGLDAADLPSPEPLRIAAALLSGEVSLAEYPMPPAEGLMPPLPTAVRFPDATEYELRHWEQILTFTVQWLNETGILTLADVPVRMVRGPGYLVNTEPIHSDGRPMVKRTQAGGPDQLWVYTKSPVTPGYYAIYHTRRNLSRP